MKGARVLSYLGRCLQAVPTPLQARPKQCP